MQFRNVKLIYLREMRDQLRDRRTLFLIAVLPLLLYPLLGTSFFQLSQFLQHHDAKVLVVGAEQLEDIAWAPPLVEDSHFDIDLFDHAELQQNLKIVRPSDFPEHEASLKQGPEIVDRAKEAQLIEATEGPFNHSIRSLLDSGAV